MPHDIIDNRNEILESLTPFLVRVFVWLCFYGVCVRKPVITASEHLSFSDRSVEKITQVSRVSTSHQSPF